jgi:hypothetical protein
MHGAVRTESRCCIQGNRSEASGNPPALGRTALFDALARALQLFGSPHVGDAIYLMTDGGENSSHSTESEVETAAANSGVRLYAVFMPVPLESRSRTRAESEGPEVIAHLTARTGGQFVTVPVQPPASGWIGRGSLDISKFPQSDRDALIWASHGFAQAIDQFYRLQLQLPTPLDKPRDLKLEIVDGSGTREKSLHVIYPQQLVPCESR